MSLHSCSDCLCSQTRHLHLVTSTNPVIGIAITGYSHKPCMRKKLGPPLLPPLPLTLLPPPPPPPAAPPPAAPPATTSPAAIELPLVPLLLKNVMLKKAETNVAGRKNSVIKAIVRMETASRRVSTAMLAVALLFVSDILLKYYISICITLCFVDVEQLSLDEGLNIPKRTISIGIFVRSTTSSENVAMMCIWKTWLLSASAIVWNHGPSRK